MKKSKFLLGCAACLATLLVSCGNTPTPTTTTVTT